MYERVDNALADFPAFSGQSANMLPFIMGDPESLPREFHGYLRLINRCDRLESGRVAYLTVHESLVRAGQSQRRPGIHTEGGLSSCWGGGGWGGGNITPPPTQEPQKPTKPAKPAKPAKQSAKPLGLYMASTDGACRIWDCQSFDVDSHGGLLSVPTAPSEVMIPGDLYWLTDRTPHEALPARQDGPRQFFRLVSHDVSVWWAEHSTANPLGVMPDCKILTGSKF